MEEHLLVSFLQSVLPIAISRLKESWGRESLFMHSDVLPKVSISDIEIMLNHPFIDLSIVDFNRSKIPRSELYSGTPWDPISLNRTKVKRLIDEGRTFIIHNNSEINRDIAELCDSIEEELPGYHADLHVYASSQKDAATYAPHRDSPQHKIFIQLFGEVHWTIYDRGSAPIKDGVVAVTEEFAKENFKVLIDRVAGPGDIIYMPDSTFHKVETLSPRVSLSFPISHFPTYPCKDRTTLSLGKYFKSTS